MTHHRTPSGFTLAETIITLGIMSLLAGLAISGGIASYARGTARTDRLTVLNALRETRAMALNGICTQPACATPASHGVHLTSSNLTLFEGPTYADRFAAADESIPLSGTKSITGTTDIVFFAGTGNTAQSQSFSMVGSDGSSQTIMINTLGTIDSEVTHIATSTL